MTRLKRIASLMLALLRELADENAYQRHLAAHGRRHSAREWREFCDRRLSARFIRPRCC